MTPLAGWLGPLSVDFFRHAYVAGIAVAVAAAVTGWFLVMRNQVFAADALSHTAFTGALCGLALGVGLRAGIYGATVAFAAVFAVLGRRIRESDVTIGITFSWILGIGVLATSVYARSGANGSAAVRVLFGSVLGISASSAAATVAVNAVVVAVVAVIARPLLFATVDRDVARAAGVPVHALDIVFLALVAVSVAQATQVVGALLVLALLATPAATAARLTARPWRGLGASVAIAVVEVAAGLWLSYVVPSLPPSTAIVFLACAGYVGASLAAGVIHRSGGQGT
jgi:zinc/manganese transport system permease protein